MKNKKNKKDKKNLMEEDEAEEETQKKKEEILTNDIARLFSQSKGTHSYTYPYANVDSSSCVDNSRRAIA